ncbi:MAG TPA: hypothetical protein PLL75_01120 [Candidatus Omnitrophota bacterium]|nr:hypothetical protein [Candidatus Omnitrophota bacterium]HPS36315.1 hypothetical protein [Candidatus Omnitrophota bacterium]
MNKRIVIAGLIALSAIVSFSPAELVLAYEDTTIVMENLQTVEGSVTAIDAEKKIITIRWMYDVENFKYEDVTLSVPDGCAVIKNGEPVELDDIENGDHITARYNPNAAPLPLAASLSIEE